MLRLAVSGRRVVLSFRFKLSISGLSCDLANDNSWLSEAVRYDNVELADVSAVCCDPSRLGVEGGSDVSR